MNDQDKVKNYEYIKKLELRVRDVKEIVQEFMKVYGIIADWEVENGKLEKDKQKSKKEFYLQVDKQLIEEKRGEEEESKVAADYELI